MNKGHVHAGEVINLNTLKGDMSPDSTYALVKTSDMEVIRMVIPEGRNIDEHSVDGQVTIQCLNGTVQFRLGNETRELSSGSWLFLDRNQPHSIYAETDAVLLVTILFT
ncbi:cupin domain-containing protein [Halalkalibaculum sp. DA3122]|uniref:cupin domain-containing protein n=1 Tax=unclassified Halalkalibaculum TaxID=2964617 RepID=UPI0037545BD8